MKKNFLKYPALCVIAIASLAISSCSDDDHYDIVGNPNNLVYVNLNAANALEAKVVHTPIGDLTTFKAAFPIRIKRAAQGTSATLELDPSLVEVYNARNKTEYAALPAGYLDLAGAAAHIQADTVASSDSIRLAFVANADLAKLTEPVYLAPLRLKVSGAGTASEDRGVVYVLVKTSTSLINDEAAAMAGSALTEATCLEADGLNKDAFTFSGWKFTKKQATASFLLDLGESKNIVGFGINSSLVTSATVELSADKSKWTEAGKTSEHSGPSVGSGWDTYTGYVFYGAVPSRYVRMTMSLDQNSWAWGYIQWGYCAIDNLAIFAE
ncbi:BT_3987 domain-containing protein [Prevotella sp. KH2C16]|uniref:BT_3987 domain-containing protein n=1 Tax=Prevotella sp. KH2C16 TaxID=1855325 RepID=UPI0008EE5712|nr:DUF1735 domain-containing protein [Prevotella sp. KH2C16]SFG03334.1 protein of unknown function [Prevotella sp. KH2C16]